VSGTKSWAPVRGHTPVPPILTCPPPNPHSHPRLPRRVFEKAAKYCEKFGGALQTSGAQAIDELSEGLSALEFVRPGAVEEAEDKRLKLEPYEIVALINLNPNSAAAAKSLIPSLEKLTDDEVDNDILRLLRRASARYTGLEG
jgi:hypothetical protein